MDHRKSVALAVRCAPFFKPKKRLGFRSHVGFVKQEKESPCSPQNPPDNRVLNAMLRICGGLHPHRSKGSGCHKELEPLGKSGFKRPYQTQVPQNNSFESPENVHGARTPRL